MNNKHQWGIKVFEVYDYTNSTTMLRLTDDAFQENVDVDEGSIIDEMIEDVGPLIHESRSSEEFDIDVKTYFEKLQNDETKIEWESDEDADEDANDDLEDDNSNTQNIDKGKADRDTGQPDTCHNRAEGEHASPTPSTIKQMTQATLTPATTEQTTQAIPTPIVYPRQVFQRCSPRTSTWRSATSTEREKKGQYVDFASVVFWRNFTKYDRKPRKKLRPQARVYLMTST
ncbi:hypothetical protein M9H77_29969 [Catharanthus roseus]|uniref:Uncharacterized protein n=1 Tax=Catharanthus roseus TaxID=4058 RepID=A0ACB9ZVV9_CATRO|nr:hypothetical protein M9H77_29969 [Catharanthus roseus]